MESDKLYRVQPEDLPRLKELLNKSFEHDPLYQELIPDASIRRRLMPELFGCDITEFYETCEIFADSKNLDGMLVVSDAAEPYSPLKHHISELEASIRTDGYLIKEDPSLKTFANFILGKDYLNSSWTEKLRQNNRLHLIYLAVDPEKQHHGIAAMLIEEAIRYADKHDMMISLETHNPKNVAFYQQFDFKIFEIMEKHFQLKQYCLIREPSGFSETQAKKEA